MHFFDDSKECKRQRERICETAGEWERENEGGVETARDRDDSRGAIAEERRHWESQGGRAKAGDRPRKSD